MYNQNHPNPINLSIIIPFYNVENYLREALNSVIDLKGISYEVILINDGSTDKSLDIALEFASHKSKFILYSNHTNKGQSHARNIGIKNAKGTYIYFLDSDDYIDSLQFSRVFGTLIEQNLDICLFNGLLFNHNDKLQERIFKTNTVYQRKITFKKPMSGYKLSNQLMKKNKYSASPCLYVFKRELVIKNKLLFIEGIIHEDEHFTPLLMINSNRAMHLDINVFFRRIRNNSTMTNLNPKKSYAGIKKGYKELIKYSDDYHNIRFYRWIIMKFYLRLLIFEIESNKKETVIPFKKIFFEYKIYQSPKIFIKYILLTLFPKKSLLMRNFKTNGFKR